MSSRFLCGMVFAIVGLTGYAGVTSDLSGSQPVSHSEAVRLTGGTERTFVLANGGCNGICNPTLQTPCSPTQSYSIGSAGVLGNPSGQLGCSTCGAANNCSVIFSSVSNE